VCSSDLITSDLDRCADYIIFIRGGELIDTDTKDGLIAKHRLVKGSLDSLTLVEKIMIGYRKSSFGFTGLAKTEHIKHISGVETEAPDLEDIMVFYSKEKRG